MAQAIRPSASSAAAELRPRAKKKSLTDNFAGALAVQGAVAANGQNKPTRTASAEGQNKAPADKAVVIGRGRIASASVQSYQQERRTPALAAGDKAVRSQSPEQSGAFPHLRPSAATAALPPVVTATRPSATSVKERLSELTTKISDAKPAALPVVKSAVKTAAKEAAAERGVIDAPQAKAHQQQTATPSSPASATSPLVASPTAQHFIAKATPSAPLPPSAQVAQLILSRQPAPGSTTSAELILRPENLGTVKVQLSVDRAGDLSAVIIASPEAMSHMQQAMDSLHHSLTEQGLSLAQFDLRQQGDNDGSRDSGGPEASRQDIALLEAETDTPPTQSAHIAGGDYLDLQI